MQRRAFVLSAACALAGTGLLRLHVLRMEQELSGGPTTRALVLARDLPTGATLTREALGERELPRAYLESRHVRARDLEQVLGARLGVPVRAAEALLWTDLAGVRTGARSLASLVPEGMRAVTLALSDSAIDALLEPGDRVDVLLTPSQRGPGAPSDAVTVAENLLVLAVGADLGRAAGQAPDASRAARRARGVSVAASLEQSRRLVAAEQAGALQLVLRNPDDLALAPPTRTPDALAVRPAGSEAD